MSRIDNKGRKLFNLVCTVDEFINELNKYFNWYTSVPDSMFKLLIPKLNPYYFSSRENHCISMAFGAKIGGKSPCVFMQNSGLGLSLDAIIGLFKLYKIGLVVFISNRGELEWEEIQHQDWGRITLPILNSIKDVNIIDFERNGLKSIEMAYNIAVKLNRVVFILMHRGNLNEQS